MKIWNIAHPNIIRVTKFAAFVIAAILLASCTQTGGTTMAEQILQISERNDALIAAQRDKLAKARLEYTQTLALVSRPNGFAKLNEKFTEAPDSPVPPKIQKASVGGSLRSSGTVNLDAPWRCVPDELKSVINHVSMHYGRVVINSTHRTRWKNRRVGGAPRSYHLHCQAIDFRVHGNTRGLYAYLRNNPNIGGLKRYRSGYYHIDTGPRRTW